MSAALMMFPYVTTGLLRGSVSAYTRMYMRNLARKSPPSRGADGVIHSSLAECWSSSPPTTPATTRDGSVAEPRAYLLERQHLCTLEAFERR